MHDLPRVFSNNTNANLGRAAQQRRRARRALPREVVEQAKRIAAALPVGRGGRRCAEQRALERQSAEELPADLI